MGEREIEFGEPIEIALPVADLPSTDLLTQAVENRERRKDDFQIYVRQGVMGKVWKHLEGSFGVEAGGVLVGHPFKAPDGKEFIVIVDSIPQQAEDVSVGHVTIDADMIGRTREEIEEKHPGLISVGWYHSHPGHGVFLSGDDLQITRSIYSSDWNVALVVDPVKGGSAFFQGAEGKRLPGWLTLQEVPDFVDEVARKNIEKEEKERRAFLARKQRDKMGEDMTGKGKPGPVDLGDVHARVLYDSDVGRRDVALGLEIKEGERGGLVWAAASDPGKERDLNEDRFVVPRSDDLQSKESQEVLAEKGRLYAVADGMGGHAAGEVASQRAIETLYRTYYSSAAETVQQRLEEAIEAANIAVLQATLERYGVEALKEGSEEKMGTTLVAAVLLGDDLYVANVGDSRAYLIRQQSIEQITRDHSWVNEQVEAGIITEQEAREHLYRNVITRSLGSRGGVEIDFFQRKVQEGDALVLCSDGLTNEVEDGGIAGIVSGNSPEKATERLIDLANKLGGPDNITAIVVRIGEIERLREVEARPDWMEDYEIPRALERLAMRAGLLAAGGASSAESFAQNAVTDEEKAEIRKHFHLPEGVSGFPEEWFFRVARHQFNIPKGDDIARRREILADEEERIRFSKGVITLAEQLVVDYDSLEEMSGYDKIPIRTAFLYLEETGFSVFEELEAAIYEASGKIVEGMTLDAALRIVGPYGLIVRIIREQYPDELKKDVIDRFLQEVQRLRELAREK